MLSQCLAPQSRSALQFYRDEVKKVMPSMSFSEMIKILENFLSFLDFAVSVLTLHFCSPAVRIRGHTICMGLPVCVCWSCAEVWSHWIGFRPHKAGYWSRLGGTVLIRQVCGLIRQVASLIGQVSLYNAYSTYNNTSCKYTELLPMYMYSYFCNARILGVICGASSRHL